MDSRGAMLLNGDGSIHVPGAEETITERHKRVDELLKGYDPDLELMFIPPKSRGVLDTKPWAVVCRPRNGQAYYVGFFDDADERLLAHIIKHDNARTNVISDLDAFNLAREAILKAEERAALAEKHALAVSVLRSSKYHYKHDGVDFGESK